MRLRKPTVVRVYSVQVKRMGRTFVLGETRTRETVTVKRWYVVLRFGHQEKRLAVSSSAVRWLRGRA